MKVKVLKLQYLKIFHVDFLYLIIKISIVFEIFSIVLVCDWECFIDRYPDVQKARWLQNPEYGSNIYQRAEWWWNEKGRKAPRDCSCGNKIHNDIEN